MKSLRYDAFVCRAVSHIYILRGSEKAGRGKTALLFSSEERHLMNIIDIKIDELNPYENNPRKNDEAVKYVAESIRQFGFKVPIVVDGDNTIIAGHTRF